MLFVLTPSCSCRSPNKTLPECLVWHLINFWRLGRTKSPDRYHSHFPIADGPLEQGAIRFRTSECLPPQRGLGMWGERGSMNLWKKLIQSHRSLAGRSWLPPDTGQVSILGNSKYLRRAGRPWTPREGSPHKTCKWRKDLYISRNSFRKL